MVPRRRRPYSNSDEDPVGKTIIYRVPPKNDIDPIEEDIEDRRVIGEYISHHADRIAPGRDGELSFD